MAKIRIVHIITRMDRGGSSDIVRILFEELDPAVFDLTLIYGLTREPALRTRTFLEELGPGGLKVSSLRRDINPFFDLVAFIQIVLLLARLRPDIVHTHTAKAGFLGRIAAKLAGVRFVVHSPHGHNLYGYFGSAMSRLVAVLERFASLFCDRIHVLTELEAKDMRDAGICAPEKLRVIYCGVEEKALRAGRDAVESLRASLKVDPQTKIAGYVGRLEPVKGPGFFVEAMPEIIRKNERVKFLIVGDGSLRQDLERRCAELNIGDRVVFLGWQDEVAPVLSTLDVLVMPSLNEAVGRSALEAQALGVPVVASRVGGVPEIVKDGQTGLLVEPRQAGALADAVVSLLGDEARRGQMSQAARSRIHESFSDRAMTEHFAGLYRDFINTRRHP